MTVELLCHAEKSKAYITCDKDHSKDLENVPWFKSFGDDSINDHNQG